jgi:hypothetical protein
MIRHLQVLLLNPLDTLKLAFKHPSAPLLDFCLAAPLDRYEEVWIILHSRLEAPPVVFEEVEVYACSAPGNLIVLDSGTVHIDEPADLLLAGLVAGESHGFVDGVREARGL